MPKQASKLKGYNNIFAIRLRKLMEERNITQDILAKEANCTRQSVSQYMDGSSVPNVDKLLSIAEYFCVSVDYLLGIATEPTTDKDINFVCEYTGLSEESISNLHLAAARTENIAIDSLLSNEYINGFYDLCMYLEDYKKHYIEFLRYKEKIVNDKTSFPKNIDEVYNIVNECERLDSDKDFKDFKLQKAFKKIVNSYCKKEVNIDKEIDEEFQKFIKCYFFHYPPDFSINSPEKIEHAFYSLKKSKTHKVNILDLLKDGDNNADNP